MSHWCPQTPISTPGPSVPWRQTRLRESRRMNHLMEDLSFIRFRRLRKNKSDEDTQTLRKTLLHNKQSVIMPEVMTSQGYRHDVSLQVGTSSPPSLPSSPPAYHSVPFSARTLGDWARTKRLEEILTMFPSDMSLKEFSHLSHSSPGRHLIINISSKKQVVVRDSRMKEKVMVAINAARAARRQSEVRWPEARSKMFACYLHTWYIV